MGNSSRDKPGGSLTYRASKRLLDIVLAILGLVALAPVMAVIAIALRLHLGAPILFLQERPGLGGVSFRPYKFRTMKELRGPEGELLPDSQRLTPLGRFLRSASLDELPELLNVLRGDMSLVGPRPLLSEYLELYSPEQARRHSVRPGITGWAQVNGRNALTWNERFELDLWYIQNRSMSLDLKILLLTLIKVLRREGISQDGHATMERFRGSKY